MSNDGLDAIGMGKVAKAIPAAAWKEVTHTFCETFSQLIAPITATTTGLARLIEARFNRLTAPEQESALEAVNVAVERVRQTASEAAKPAAAIIIASIESVAVETDETMRELWINLIAQEMSGAQVHPEFPQLLRRMSREDARTFVSIAEASNRPFVQKLASALWQALQKNPFIWVALGTPRSKTTFSHEHLIRLGLIKRVEEDEYRLTRTGRAFLSSVTDPSEALRVNAEESDVQK